MEHTLLNLEFGVTQTLAELYAFKFAMSIALSIASINGNHLEDKSDHAKDQTGITQTQTTIWFVQREWIVMKV